MRTWYINKANDFTFHYIKFLGQEMKVRCKESFGQLSMSDVMKPEELDLHVLFNNP